MTPGGLGADVVEFPQLQRSRCCCECTVFRFLLRLFRFLRLRFRLYRLSAGFSWSFSSSYFCHSCLCFCCSFCSSMVVWLSRPLVGAGSLQEVGILWNRNFGRRSTRWRPPGGGRHHRADSRPKFRPQIRSVSRPISIGLGEEPHRSRPPAF